MEFDSNGRMHQSRQQAEQANAEYRRREANPEAYAREQDSKLTGLFVLLSLVAVPVFCFNFFEVIGFSARKEPAFYFFVAMCGVFVGGYVFGLYKYCSKNFPGGMLGFNILFFLVLALLIFLLTLL